jgi:large subunit ribosomal protein L29
MSFKTFTGLKNFKEEELIKEIISAKKELFSLRLKKATRQSFKPHLFTHTKRKIAQLLTIESERKQHTK